ncbi:unnamed protein product [Durusdinium trenchii]|uniref:Uncharacterized protein n=2 Tax=Durusdinium trenchii TaxID=1381693 RepID=A0ABP0QS24_9DINO
MLRKPAFLAASLTVAHLVPLFLKPMQASWGWSASMPMCIPKSGGNWTFADGSASIAAGTSANVTCSNGDMPFVMTVMCPESTPINKTMDPEWWSTCGGGDSCKASREIGDDIECPEASTTAPGATAAGSASSWGFSASLVV